jgi:hypothetical protein
VHNPGSRSELSSQLTLSTPQDVLSTFDCKVRTFISAIFTSRRLMSPCDARSEKNNPLNVGAMTGWR